MPKPDPNGVTYEDELNMPDEYGESLTEKDYETPKPIEGRLENLYTQADFKAFNDEFLIINDIALSGIPTSEISIESNNNVFIAETLRSQSPIVSSNGIHDWTITMSLNFQSGPAQTDKLHRLVAQIARHPLVYVFNGRIRKALNISDPTVTTMFVVDSGTLRNSPKTVGDIILDLTLHYFNYKPFSNHFWFNTKMPGYREEEKSAVETEKPAQLFTEGYEASSHSIDYESEKIAQELRDETLKIASGPNVPITFPSTSDAWMYYADHLVDLTPSIYDRTSDHVDFVLRMYEHHNPPEKEQRLGAGTPEEVYTTKFTYPDYSEIYNAMTKPTTEKPYKVASDYRAEQASPRLIGHRPPVKIQKASTGEEISVPLLDGNNKVIISSLEAFSKLCYPRKNPPPSGTLMDHNCLIMLQKVADRFPGKDIVIYSGIRNYGKGKGVHAEGRAIDFKVQGVNNEDLFTFIATNFKSGGAGYYPNNHPSGGSQFVHMDSRKTRMVLWVDESGRGAPSQLNKHHEVLRKIRNVPPVDNNDIKTEAAHLAGIRQDRKDEQTNREGVVSSNTKRITESDKYTIDKSRDFEARSKWKEQMAEIGLHYYWDDPKIRNVFYRDIEFNISSNPEDQRNGYAASGIVFSAISVTFGHRIVPHKLCGQDTYTWQFLGAGNKTGTMVFTFSDTTGRESADKLKALINAARENARTFRSLIQGVGSIGVGWDKSISRERNSILALLDINNIVVTDITEASIDDGSDRHQLILNFVVQDFAEENFDKRFVTNTDMKRRIISRIMDMLQGGWSQSNEYKPKEEKLLGLIDGREIKDYQLIMPHVKYMSIRSRSDTAQEQAHFSKTGTHIGGAARPYKINDPSFPSWIAEILITAAEYCQEVDDNIPPTAWTINVSGETWKDRYAYWGAGDIIKGRVLKIHEQERNSVLDESQRHGLQNSSRRIIQWDEMYKGRFQYDGQDDRKTNNLHAVRFNKWLNQMNSLVQEVRKHITDEENFRKYFGTVGEEMLDSLIENTGECYSDMFLPPIPGGSAILPPEFYVYDDSGEDPALSTLTNDQNMVALLEKHIDNEIASIERYVTGVICGGSYISKNLPRIIESRKQYLDKFSGKDRNSGEGSFFSFSEMMKEGTRAWQPIFYRENDPAYSREETQHWINRVSKDFGKNDDAKFKFMDNLIKLSPYLRDGHGKSWQTPYNGAPPEYMIETIYDEDWKDLSFGPNPAYTYADSIMNGIPPNQTSKEALNRVQEQRAIDKAVEGGTGGEILGLNRAVTSDGAITVGDPIKENQNSRISAVLQDVVSDLAGFVTSKGLDIVASTFQPLAGIRIAVTMYNDYKNYKAKQSERSQKKMEDVISSYDHPIADVFDSDNSRTKIAELASGIATGTKAKDINIRRAFPTFKIYFIEDDAEETEQVDGKVIRAFDDFYSYSAIQEIRISRSRKVAADMAVIRITNIGGKLLRKRFGDKPGWEEEEKAKSGERAEYSTGIFADTEKENPFESMILQDGVKVQIRLGYASNPDHLESVFLGSIVEIQPDEDGKILQLVCQGFGAELEGVELGPLNDGPVFYSTQQVLSGSIIQDSIVNFGRRSKFNKFNPSEARHSFQGGEGRGLLAGITPAQLFDVWGRQKLYRHFYRYSFRNYPQDDNIFAPPPHVYTTTWERTWDNACIYRPLKQTPWQIFKEHELRHPGYISMAVPYGHAPRMTMFFGAKGQHYWSKPPSALELFLSETASDAVIQMRGMSQKDILGPEFSNKLIEISKNHPKLARTIIKSITNFGSPTSVSTEIAKLFGRYRPFRNYHYFDSSHHILKNKIRTNSDGTANQVEVLYFGDEEEIEEDDVQDLSDNLRSLSLGEEGIYSCKLDDNIPEEHIRSYREEFPSCVTEFMAKRYAQGLFARLLRDAYKGELIVLGEPTLKPYDICFLNDTSINMTGPIEVEAVEHIFNRDHGFISIITPDLCVDMNDMYSASIFNVTGSALAYMFGFVGLDLDPDQANVALSAIASPLVFLAVMGGVKFATWMQEGTPVITTPLTFQGKPFLSVNIGQKRASFITSIHGKWSQYWDDLGSSWDKLDVAEGLFGAHLSLRETLFGLFTADPGGSLPTAL
jgi:hypothetical protein